MAIMFATTAIISQYHFKLRDFAHFYNSLWIIDYEK